MPNGHLTPASSAASNPLATSYEELLKQVRHPDRIRSSDLIERLVEDFTPLASPDPALLAGTGHVSGHPVLVLGQEKPKGRDAQRALDVNFGMMRAVGYWFAVEQVERAAAKNLAVLTLIDTPGADPTKGGVDHLVAWAVSASISAFINFPGPSVSAIVGEGGSGGAVALQVSDRRLMVSDAIYSVIAPEACSAILHRDRDHVPEAMQVLRPSAEEVARCGIVDDIIDWPGGIASSNHDRAAEILGHAIAGALDSAAAISREQRVAQRMKACVDCGQLTDEWREGPTFIKRAEAPRLKRFANIDRRQEDQDVLRLSGDQPNRTEDDVRCAGKDGCGAVFPVEECRDAGWTCPACGRSERLRAAQWIDVLCDADSFQEELASLDLAALDHGGYDSDTYREQRRKTRERTGAAESLRVGVGSIEGVSCAFAVSEFAYMGGSLGAVAGEKIRYICELARQRRLPLVSVICSGGARMQDGTLGLAQMAKTNAAVGELMRAGLRHVAIMADPCTGGAMASYATSANAILAEPRALLSFAGPRVLELAGLPVNVDELVSERYAQHGGLDEVVPRHHLKRRVLHFLQTQTKQRSASLSFTTPPREAPAERRVSAWFGDLVNRLASVVRGDRSLFEERFAFEERIATTEPLQTNIVSQLVNLAQVEIPALLSQAIRSDHVRVRAEAAIGLLKMDANDGASIATIEEMLAAPDPDTRKLGLYAVTAAPNRCFRDPVARLSDAPDPTVGLAAGVALAAIGEPDTAVTVIRALMESRATLDTGECLEPLLAMMDSTAAQALRDRLATR